ncbi:hypothetical protein A4A49_29538 [Nicotiana attenuata]|uniref:Uncharacterized protein n=1 Tax=Nicotiana attenuata TaxID=49451 RepID=A0A314KI72_NICAT|nr:hypothetical protein A4A49_29538 [Nicotiana attenuata]
MGDQSFNPNPSFSQSRKQKKTKNGKKHPYEHPSIHRLYQSTTSGPPTGLLVGGGFTRSGTLLRVHSGQQEGDADSPKSGSPCQSDIRSSEQSPNGVWAPPMAVNGNLGMSVTDHRPSSSQLPHSPELSSSSFLSRPNEGGPSSRTEIYPDRALNDSISVYPKESEQTSTPPKHPPRSFQSPRLAEKQGISGGGGADVPNAKNRVDCPGFGEINRVQFTSERDCGGSMPQSNDQVRARPSFNSNHGPNQALDQSYTNTESEEENPKRPPCRAPKREPTHPPRFQ